MNIASELLNGLAERMGSANLFETAGGPGITQADFLSRVANRSRELSDFVSPGEMVIIASGRGIDFFTDMFALWSLSAVAIPYAPSDGPQHLQLLQQISGAALYLDQANIGIGNGYAVSSPSLQYTQSPASSPCVVLFTSGSTGLPKGVVLSQEVLLGNAKSTMDITKIKGERILVNVPFHFTSCICHFLSACLSGSTFIGIENKYMYSDFVHIFVSTAATGIGGAPVQLRWLAEAGEDEYAYLKDKLRFAFSSGDHLPNEVSAKLRERYPHLRLFTAYGLTELGGRFCVLPPEETPAHLGSVGRPISGLAVRIVDPDTAIEMPTGEEGEVVATGSLMSDGYLNNPEETNAAFRDNSLYTGDLGYLDEAGYLHVTGRASDIFKVNGKKVSSISVANSLMQTGIFTDAAVVGLEVPIFGTVPIACCVMRPDKRFEKGPILRQLRQTLPNSHIPHAFIMLDAIPRTGSGKVKRTELRMLALRNINLPTSSGQSS